MLGHLHFNTKYISRRVSTWVMLAVLLILSALLYWIVPNYLIRDSSGKLPISDFYPFIISIIIGTYWMIFSITCSAKALNIFRDPETDGTELIILAKPITRATLLSAKFIMFWAVMLIYVFAQLPFLILGAGLAGTNIGVIMGGYLLSSLLMILLFGALAILLASAMGTVGTTITQIVIAIVVFALLPNAIFGTIDSLKNSKVANYFDIGNQISNLSSVFARRTPLISAGIANVDNDALGSARRAPPYWSSIIISLVIGFALHTTAAFIYARRDFK